MSTIRYTAGGDYDPLNSSDITPQDAKGPFTSVVRFTDRFANPPVACFEVDDRSGSVRFLRETNFHTDGLYADLSDNTRGALIAGGDMGDVLIGGRGGDTLYGKGGADQLFGGAGADTFRFTVLADFGVSGSLCTIKDFSGVAHDKIDLSFIASFGFNKGHGFSEDGTAQIYVTENKHGFEIVHGDADGNGVQDFSLRVRADATLTAHDFNLGNTSSALPAISFAAALPLYDAHPAFGGGMHIMAHLAIA